MKKSIYIMTLGLLTLNVSGQTGIKNFIDQNYIEVVGKSEMEIAPDLIYIKVNINEKDTKNKVPVTELEKSMVSTLVKLGIDVSKDLLIKDISSNFKYYLLTKNDILLTKEYQILVRDGKIASQIFIELEKIGISNISIDRLDHSKIEQFRREVKINAITAAKSKAESLAQAINQAIGRAIYIQELDNFANVDRENNSISIRGSSAIYGSSAPIDIDFEKIKIEFSILCRFELK